MKQVVIGLCGGKGEGKDTLAKHLVSKYGFLRLAFADELYAEVAAAYGVTVDELQARDTKEQAQEKFALVRCKDQDFVRAMLDLASDDDVVADYLEAARSPRWVLQHWGTEYRRKTNDGYWRDIVEAQLQDAPRVVITDVRFPDEANLVLKYTGQVRRVKAVPPPEADKAALHSSERALDAFDFSCIENVWGAPEVLYEQGDNLMQEFELTPA